MNMSRLFSSTLFATACACGLLPMTACAHRTADTYPDTMVESHQRARASRDDGSRDNGEASGKPVTKSHAATASQLENERRITNEVRAKLDRDHATYDNTFVSVRDGVVSLRGDVPSEGARSEAITRATQVMGVVRVESHLRVTSL